MSAPDLTPPDPSEPFLPTITASEKTQQRVSEFTEGHAEIQIAKSALLRVLQGVAVATKAPEGHVKAAADWFAAQLSGPKEPSRTPSVENTNATIAWTSISSLLGPAGPISQGAGSVETGQLVRITGGVTFLREASRNGINVTADDLDLVWRIIYTAISDSSQSEVTYTISRSAQGFLAIPLCSLVKDGNIEELFRFHIWMPDGQRGAKEFGIHSYQSFAQSWILAGVGTDRQYEVQVMDDNPNSEATHAEYALSWNNGKTQSTTYQTHQVSSMVENTHRYVSVKPLQAEIHMRDDTYSIPSARFHTSEVENDTVHATLFFFDSSRGFYQNTRVLGPKDLESFQQIRDSGGQKPGDLMKIVHTLRSYELHMRHGLQHATYAELEYAMKEFDIALHIIESSDLPTDLSYYRQQALGAFGVANRRLGRYQMAKEYLEKALETMKPCRARVDISGELGVVYRHMGLMEEAKKASQVEHDTALQLDFRAGVGRALGTLGMINYQLSQENNDESLLRLAIEQLNERVNIARSITDSINLQNADHKHRVKQAQSSIKREFIGLSRLSLCYTALGDLQQAQAKALRSLNLTYELNDPTDIAMSNFFYGRTLLRDGRHEEALKHFNASEGCSPAVMMCQEPSEEHRGYLQELIDAGAHIDLIDEQGYTPLDYTIFSGDHKARQIVLSGLRRQLSGDAEEELIQRQKRANIQKAYRELFQEQLRPTLLKGGDEVFRTLRASYARALASDREKRKLYDGFKFIWYNDFLDFGRLPRSTDNMTHEFAIDSAGKQSTMPDFVIFFSYRWINSDSTVSLPDDEEETQYNRMKIALKEYLTDNQGIDLTKLGIWVDFACIDQENPAPGVLALPLNLAQCNVIISLMDEVYDSRAWCSVEALLALTLRDSYSQHQWYEQVPSGVGDDVVPKYKLQKGRANVSISMAQKHLSFEQEDRPKVVFLERQRHLLCRS